jgi:hypothetical protein
MNVERASSRVKAGLGVIWKSVTEAAGVADAVFERYFRFDIVTLSHKVCPSSSWPGISHICGIVV